MTDAERKVDCRGHGLAQATFVCGHLAKHPRQQWYCAYPDQDNPWPDAWCGACDQAFQREGEWNDNNELVLDLTMRCHHCYEEFKGSSVAPLMEARAASWHPYLSDAVSELQAKQDLLDERFAISRHDRWDLDLEAGEIVFAMEDKPLLIAGVQVVGTVSTLSETWLWSWANYKIPTNAVSELSAVRDFGEAENFANLTVPKWPAEAVDGWEMTAVAAKVLGASGAYRTPNDTGFTYLSLMDVRPAQ
jgi:hypothetical protein